MNGPDLACEDTAERQRRSRSDQAGQRLVTLGAAGMSSGSFTDRGKQCARNPRIGERRVSQRHEQPTGRRQGGGRLDARQRTGVGDPVTGQPKRA